MEMKASLSVAVLEVLDKDNYVTWSVQVKTYLMAKDLWDIVEAIIEPHKQEDDEVAFNAWCEKNSMALNAIQVSCGPDALSIIRQISSAKIAWNTLAVFCQVLKEDNYVEWSVRVKTYLMALDLWEIIEATTEPLRREDNHHDEATFKAWSKKNSTVLHIIQISCGSNTFYEIIEISFAKIAWDMLAKKYLHVLEEDNYVDWSVKVKTYLMAHDLWETVEATTNPPKQEDDEHAFKVWSKKNSMALHVIQISCGLDSFFEIIGISSAKVAWDTLGKKFNSGIDAYYVQYEDLKKAMESGDWNTAEEFLKRQPDAKAAKITNLGETALHVAVKAGHEDIVEKLVDLISKEDLAIPDIFGNTALVYIINAGNYRMAACMLRKRNNLIRIKDSSKCIPVNQALFTGHVELARYLYSLTPLEDLMPERGVDGATLCTQAIYNRSLYMALDLFRKCPRLALALDKWGSSPLYALANMPNALSSGDGLVFWKRWIYNYCIHIEPAGVIKETRLDIQSLEKRQSDKGKIIESIFLTVDANSSGPSRSTIGCHVHSALLQKNNKTSKGPTVSLPRALRCQS